MTRGGEVMEIQGYDMPDDLYYEENHFWVKEEGDLVVMGMDDFAQKMAGEIVYVQLPDEGKALKVGKKFAKIESGKWLGKVFAPVNGELAAVNEALETNPGLINEDCYGKGWMYKIKADDKGELANLIRGPEAVEKWVLADIEKYSKE
jgi:glycine cleavage system H protein